ncbi:YifB family Mg chelatase-like AAA ATPase [Nonomuraea sp. KM90]|uniref:YifB family Mg chelatase-like AAA ATPase n=1 Tax=Nonomuraea sp. KM90 TaxID=3457428 RepID=UPI003FCC6BC0
MALAAVSSAVVIGLSGHVVRIEADVSPGLPGFHLIGLPDTVTAQTRDRVRAAILNSGWDWPDQRITVNVLPSELPKYGSALDLAIAVAILAAAGTMPTEPLAHTAFLGELGLDGSLRHVRGLPSAIRALIVYGARAVVVPVASTTHTGQWAVIPASSLTDLVKQLTNGARATVPNPPATAVDVPELDLADLPGNQAAKDALEISAAGGHHLLLQGRGPCAALAACLPGILPPLEDTSHTEVSEIHSLTETPWQDRRRPLCAPHHTSTAAAIFGRRGLGLVRPGAVSLAHAGVLFLDEAPEFARSILDGLRYPLDTGEVILADAGGILHLPARFQLLLATHPCPCDTTSCHCGTGEQRRYLNRLTTLRERIELTAPLEPHDWTAEPGESTAIVAERVVEARARAAHRLKGTPRQTNAEIPGLELRSTHRLDPDALDPLDTPLRSGTITPAAMTQILRVAWTLADLRAAARPGKDDTHQALLLWRGEPL